MIEIKDLLLRWSTLIASKEENKDLLREIISETLGVAIDSNDIKIKNGTVYLNIKPIYRSEILLKKEEIFNKLKDALGDKAPKDIR